MYQKKYFIKHQVMDYQIKQMKKAAKAEIKRTKAEAKQKKKGQTTPLESNDTAASVDGETGSVRMSFMEQIQPL